VIGFLPNEVTLWDDSGLSSPEQDEENSKVKA
jgi:hypothetical protein